MFRTLLTGWLLPCGGIAIAAESQTRVVYNWAEFAQEPNNPNPRLLNPPCDPNNDYSIPYRWRTTGIAYNTDKIRPGQPASWADLWDPAYKNKLLLLNDMREVFSMSLKVLGYAINTTDEHQIRAAYEKLGELMPN